jgi:S-adenosylmethionine:tRNA ribosyltransferase-isomerase
MTIKTKQIRIAEYNYPLPDERIARFPLEKRDESKLLLFRNGEISESKFKNLPEFLPKSSLVVFNNTRVIRARVLFQKSTGAKIELFCLEPIVPHDYALVFQQTECCSWLCLIGNAKKWKTES